MKFYIALLLILINIGQINSAEIDNKYIELQTSILKEYFVLLADIINKDFYNCNISGELILKEVDYHENYKSSNLKLLNLYYISNNKILLINEEYEKYKNIIDKYNNMDEKFNGDFNDIKIIQYSIDYANNKIDIFFRNGYWWYSGSIKFIFINNKIYFTKIPESIFPTD